MRLRGQQSHEMVQIDSEILVDLHPCHVSAESSFVDNHGDCVLSS